MKDTLRSEAYRKKKVVYKDENQFKIFVGFVTYEHGFLKVTNTFGQSMMINKTCVISIKDLEW